MPLPAYIEKEGNMHSGRAVGDYVCLSATM